MKLIVSHLETLRTYVTREFYYVTTNLMSDYGWKHIEICKLWNDPGTIRTKLLQEFGELPETILFCEAYEFLCAHLEEIIRLDCRKVFFADDLHWWNEPMRKMKLRSFESCEIILSTYGYVWGQFYPELSGSKKVVWIPHAASPDFMLPYNPCPENSIFLSGAMSQHYPLRLQMMDLHSHGSYSIAYHAHPGYFCGYDYQTNGAIGRGYAEKINRYRAAFTDSLRFKYVIAKYVEIPATGALLFADDAVSGPLQELGLLPNRHYLPASKENLEERVQYVLEERNHEELDAIRKCAQELVWERHKTSDRARQIDEACQESSAMIIHS